MVHNLHIFFSAIAILYFRLFQLNAVLFGKYDQFCTVVGIPLKGDWNQAEFLSMKTIAASQSLFTLTFDLAFRWAKP